MPCIFCKIVRKDAEASVVFEDREIFAFMDIQPVRAGQVLIIPKKHTDHFSDVGDRVALKIFRKARRIVKIIEKKLKPDRVGMVINGYGVSHAHLIIIPLEKPGDITTARAAAIKKGKIIFSAENWPFAKRKDLDKVAKLLARNL